MHRIKEVAVKRRTTNKAILNRRLAERNLPFAWLSAACINLPTVEGKASSNEGKRI
jgi:hypothetical protein